MRTLFSAALLLAGCTLPPAYAQVATAPPPTATATAPALHWATAEFCEAYSHYYRDLPSLYRYHADQALQQTPLAAPQADMAALLVQQPALREAVFRTLYQYCHTLKYGLDNRSEVEELLYQFLYQDLHMSSLAADYLAPQLATRYQQPAPAGLAQEATPTPARGATPIRETPQAEYRPRGLSPRALHGEPGSARRLTTSDAEDDEPTMQPALVGAPGSGRKQRIVYAGSGLELAGWRFETPPTIEAVEGYPGVVRFRIQVGENGAVESVTKVSGNVSPAQEKLCRDKLLGLRFVSTDGRPARATGYYNIRFAGR